MNRSRKKLKSRVIPSKEDKHQKLYNQTLKLSKKVNSRLKSLERRYSSGTWSSKKLFNRVNTTKIGNPVKNNRIMPNESMNNTQLIYLQKAMNQFLNSKTSTKKGIKDVAEETKKSLKAALSIDDEDITDVDIDEMYEMLANDDFDFFNEKIGASAMWITIEDAKEVDETEDNFINRLELYMDLPDEEARTRARRLYNKYVM